MMSPFFMVHPSLKIVYSAHIGLFSDYILCGDFLPLLNL